MYGRPPCEFLILLWYFLTWQLWSLRRSNAWRLDCGYVSERVLAGPRVRGVAAGRAGCIADTSVV